MQQAIRTMSVGVLGPDHPSYVSFTKVTWTKKIMQKYVYCKLEIFVQYIFSRISHSVLGARKYDVSEKINHYIANRNNC